VAQGDYRTLLPPLSPEQYAHIVAELELQRRRGTPAQFQGQRVAARRGAGPTEVARWELPEREMVSVSTSREDAAPILAAGADPISIVGPMRFGAGGVMQEFQFDWADGSLLSVPAQTVYLLADYQQPSPAGSGQRVELSASLTRGARASPTPVKRTLTAVTTAVDIPPRTHSVSLWSSNVADYANMLLRFFSARGGAPTAVVSPGDPHPIPVPWPSIQLDVVPIAGVLRGNPNVVCLLTV